MAQHPNLTSKADLQIRNLREQARSKTKREVLSHLADYYCLRLQDLAELLAPNPTDVDRRRVQRAVLDLFQTGWLNRLPFLELDRSRGNVGFVYGLSDRGVAEFGGKTFDDHALRTLDHELEISLFHMAMTHFADKYQQKLFWLQRALKRGIHPDALLKLTDQSGESRFFIEVERLSPKVSDDAIARGKGIIPKLQRYKQLYDTDQCEKDWGFRKFRVIVILTDNKRKPDTRRQNLLAALKEKLPYKMFWLTTDSLFKRDIAGKIFFTPKDFEHDDYSFLTIIRETALEKDEPSRMLLSPNQLSELFMSK